LCIHHLPAAAKRVLDILKAHDEGFNPATAIAATRYASTLLACGNPQEAQVCAVLCVLCWLEGEGALLLIACGVWGVWVGRGRMSDWCC
jgi:hypothetical protein